MRPWSGSGNFRHTLYTVEIPMWSAHIFLELSTHYVGSVELLAWSSREFRLWSFEGEHYITTAETRNEPAIPITQRKVLRMCRI